MNMLHILDTRAAETALRRARKRLAHATRAAAEDKSARIMRRRQRRAWNAERLAGEAHSFLAELEAIDLDEDAFA